MKKIVDWFKGKDISIDDDGRVFPFFKGMCYMFFIAIIISIIILIGVYYHKMKILFLLIPLAIFFRRGVQLLQVPFLE